MTNDLPSSKGKSLITSSKSHSREQYIIIPQHCIPTSRASSAVSTSKYKKKTPPVLSPSALQALGTTSVNARFTVMKGAKSSSIKFNERFETKIPAKQPPLCEEKARAWLEQAKVDYKAAQDILNVTENSEANCQYPALVCFLCHDVVEKCLKGLLYVYSGSTHLNSSNLVSLFQDIKSAGVKNEDLLTICNETVMVVSVYENRSRYPHYHTPSCAPAAMYVLDNAIEALSAVTNFMTRLRTVALLKNLIGDIDIIPKPRFISTMKSNASDSKLF